VKGRSGRGGALFNLLPPGSTDLVTPLELTHVFFRRDDSSFHQNFNVYMQSITTETVLIIIRKMLTNPFSEIQRQ